MSASERLAIIPSDVRRVAEQAAVAVRRCVGADAQIWWIGSWMRGDAHPGSDLDLVIDAGRALTPEESLDVRDALDALWTLRRVDVIDVNASSPAWRQRAMSEGEPL